MSDPFATMIAEPRLARAYPAIATVTRTGRDCAAGSVGEADRARAEGIAPAPAEIKAEVRGGTMKGRNER